ncbi:hypothetical protein ACFQYP_51695 [Nonomuraea antimicrobica]
MPGLEGVRLAALSPAAANQLLNVRTPGLTTPVQKRVLAEADGNPLAIIELGSEIRSGRPVPGDQAGPLRVAGRVQDVFRPQLAALPPATRLLMAVAAAAENAGLNVILRAAARAGADASDLGPAEQARFISVSGDEVRFRHPPPY